MKKIKIFFLVLLVLIGFYSFAADSSYIKINFDTSLSLDRFSVMINDGINEDLLKLETNSFWEGELFCPFGYLLIRYDINDTAYATKKFFFEKGKLNLDVIPSKNKNEFFFVDEKSQKNLIPYSKMGGDLLDSFTMKERENFTNFYQSNRTQFGVNPALVHEAFLLTDTLNYKKVEFIKKYPDSFMAFWVFETLIVHTETLKPDSLMKLYNAVLTDKYKKCKAGEYVFSLIKNKVAIVSNLAFPTFSVSDIYGNNVQSSKLKDKIILIQFWASWCHPCLDELPTLKELNEQYKNQDFKFISFSIDKDSIAFQNAIKRYSMNWTQVFRGSPLFNSIGGSGVPQIYLIDKSGKVIYDNVASNDENLILLKKTLSEQFRN